VIVSERVGSAPDLLINGINGFSFNPLEEQSLVNHLLALSSDDALGAHLRRNAYSVMELWPVTRFADGLAKATAKAFAFPRRPLQPLSRPLLDAAILAGGSATE
jgi:glycosyltransferase involved in cell wall biosynthesis